MCVSGVYFYVFSYVCVCVCVYVHVYVYVYVYAYVYVSRVNEFIWMMLSLTTVANDANASSKMAIMTTVVKDAMVTSEDGGHC